MPPASAVCCRIAGKSSPVVTAALVAVALGSNLGNRHARIAEAITELHTIVDGLVCSTVIETEPVGVDPQPLFLNAVVVGETRLSVRVFFRCMQEIETRLGRERPYAGAPRTIDLDLVLYGDTVVTEPGLAVPHPRFRERGFVLGPLAEVAPGWRDPVSGRTMAELYVGLLTA